MLGHEQSIAKLIEDFDQALNYDRKTSIKTRNLQVYWAYYFQAGWYAFCVMFPAALIFGLTYIVSYEGEKAGPVLTWIMNISLFTAGVAALIGGLFWLIGMVGMMVNHESYDHSLKIKSRKKTIDPEAEKNFIALQEKSAKLVSHEVQNEVSQALDDAWQIALRLEKNDSKRSIQTALVTAMLSQILLGGNIAKEIELFEKTRSESEDPKEVKLVQDLKAAKKELVKTVKQNTKQLNKVNSRQEDLTLEAVDFSGVLEVSKQHTDFAIKLLERARG